MKPGTDIDRARATAFDVWRALGHGTTGTVYLARETELRRLVAINVPVSTPRPASRNSVPWSMAEYH
jgi:hypothetical protein